MEEKAEMLGLVAYCDGGCNPNPGPVGSGVHGYTYTLPKEKERPTRINNWMATTEGYVPRSVFDEGGYQGVVVVDVVNLVESTEFGTNNVGELRSVLLLFSHEIVLKCQQIHIISDSKEIVVAGINERMEGWRANGWRRPDGNEVKNSDLWEQVYQAVKAYRDIGELKVSWIRAHQAHYGNDQADYLATVGVSWARDGDPETNHFAGIESAKSYYKDTPEIHPFLSLKRLYFNSNNDYNEKGIYFMTDGSGKDFVLGRRTAEAVYAVVHLKEDEPILEKIIEIETQQDHAFNDTVYLKTERLSEPLLHRFITTFGRHATLTNKNGLAVKFLDEQPLVSEISPGELPYRAIDILTQLREILNLFETNFLAQGKPVQGNIYQVFDLTDVFFETKIKKSKQAEVAYMELRKAFAPGCKDTKATVEYEEDGVKRPIDLLIRLGQDLPPRNAFKKVELFNPMVYAITWKDGTNLLRYAFLIKGDHCAGIWSNYHTNLILL